MNDSMFAFIEAQYKHFVAMIPMINTFVNAGNEEYKEYYIDDQNAFFFSS